MRKGAKVMRHILTTPPISITLSADQRANARDAVCIAQQALLDAAQDLSRRNPKATTLPRLVTAASQMADLRDCLEGKVVQQTA